MVDVQCGPSSTVLELPLTMDDRQSINGVNIANPWAWYNFQY